LVTFVTRPVVNVNTFKTLSGGITLANMVLHPFSY
ncbi:unnamed protein product, partial [Allacma fusca]